MLGQPRQSLRIEGVGWIEDADVGLIQARQRDRLHLQPVVRQHVFDQSLDLFDEAATFLLHLVHGHAGGHAAQRIDESALDQFLEGLGIHRPPAERLGRRGHGFPVGANSQKEVSYDLHSHAVLGDECRGAGAPHLQTQGRHADPGDVVDDREDQRAAAQDDLLAAKSGAHEGDFFRGALVEPVEQIDDDRDEDSREQDCSNDVHSGHESLSSSRFDGSPHWVCVIIASNLSPPPCG